MPCNKPDRHVIPIEYRGYDLGQSFDLELGKGAAAGDMLVYLLCKEDENGRTRLKGCAKTEGETSCGWLDDFPLEFREYSVVLEKERAEGARLRIEPRGCTDEDFLGDVSHCMPITATNFRGIAVAAPAKVDFGKAVAARAARLEAQRYGNPESKGIPQVRICGRTMFNHGEMARFEGATSDSPVLHLTNTATGSTISRTFDAIALDEEYRIHGILSEPALPPDDFGEPSEPDPNMSSGGPFVIELGMYLDPPEGTVVYRLVIEHGPYRSEELEIEVSP